MIKVICLVAASVSGSIGVGAAASAQALRLQTPSLQTDEAWKQLQKITREAVSLARKSIEDDPAATQALIGELVGAHQRFLQSNPKHAKAWIALAKLHVDQEDMASADRAFARSWAADPSATGTGVAWAAAWMNRDSARGIAVLDSCIAADGMNLVLHNNRLRALELFDKAGIVTRFDALLADNAPEDGIATASTMLDALNRANPRHARTFQVQLQKAAPNHPEVITTIARLRRSQNEFGAARALMEQLPEGHLLQPTKAYLFSDTCYGMHDFEQANAVMQAIDLAPLAETSPGLHRRLKFLKPLRQQAADEWIPEQQQRLADASAHDNPIVVLVIDGQEVWCELFADTAPNTVAAFLAVAESGFHNNRTAAYVHGGFRSIFGERSEADTMPEWTLPSEFDPATDRPHNAGSLVAFRHAARPDSADTRFYVLHFPAPHLQGHRTNFGRVISGLHVIRHMVGDETLNDVRIVHRGSSKLAPEAILPDGTRVPLRGLLEQNAMQSEQPLPTTQP